MNMQNACATLFKIKIGFRFQIWFRMRLSVSEIQRQCWKILGRNKYDHCNKRPRWKAATGDKCWKLLETLPTSFGGWECFGTDLQLVSTICQISPQEMSNSRRSPTIWGKCQSFDVALSSIEKNTIFWEQNRIYSRMVVDSGGSPLLVGALMVVCGLSLSNPANHHPNFWDRDLGRWKVINVEMADYFYQLGSGKCHRSKVFEKSWNRMIHIKSNFDVDCLVFFAGCK